MGSLWTDGGIYSSLLVIIGMILVQSFINRKRMRMTHKIISQPIPAQRRFLGWPTLYPTYFCFFCSFLQNNSFATLNHNHSMFDDIFHLLIAYFEPLWKKSKLRNFCEMRFNTLINFPKHPLLHFCRWELNHFMVPKEQMTLLWTTKLQTTSLLIICFGNFNALPQVLNWLQ